MPEGDPTWRTRARRSPSATAHPGIHATRACTGFRVTTSSIGEARPLGDTGAPTRRRCSGHPRLRVDRGPSRPTVDQRSDVPHSGGRAPRAGGRRRGDRSGNVRAVPCARRTDPCAPLVLGCLDDRASRGRRDRVAPGTAAGIRVAADDRRRGAGRMAPVPRARRRLRPGPGVDPGADRRGAQPARAARPRDPGPDPPRDQHRERPERWDRRALRDPVPGDRRGRRDRGEPELAHRVGRGDRLGDRPRDRRRRSWRSLHERSPQAGLGLASVRNPSRSSRWRSSRMRVRPPSAGTASWLRSGPGSLSGQRLHARSRPSSSRSRSDWRRHTSCGCCSESHSSVR